MYFKISFCFFFFACFLLSESVDLCDQSIFTPFNTIGTYQYRMTSYDKAVNCIQSLPFIEEERSATLTVLRKARELHGFHDVIQDSPFPFHVQVNITKELDIIESNSYTSRYDFHTDLGNIYLNMHDAHSYYIKPLCFKFTFLQPFEYIPIMDSNSVPRLKISNVLQYFNMALGVPIADLINGFKTTYNFDPSLYVNATILTINGMDGISFMKNWTHSNRSYASKDDEIRFNIAIRSDSFNPFALSSAYYDGYESQSDVVYELLMPTGDTVTLNATWLVLNRTPFNNTSELEQLCVTTPLTKKSLKDAPQKRYLKSVIPSKEDRVPISSYISDLTPIIIGDSFYAAIINNTIVLKLTSFEIDPTTFYQLLGQVTTLLSENTNINRVIVDVQNNGGGYVVDAGILIHYLTGVTRKNYTIYDQIFSNYYNDYALYWAQTNEPALSPQSYLNVSTVKSFTDFTFFTNGRNYTRGGSTSAYSQPFKYDFGEDPSFPSVSSRFSPSSIIIVTDGACGSTCSQFITTMQQLNLGITVGIGGYFDTTVLESSSFPGGVVSNSDEEINLIGELDYYYNPTFTSLYSNDIPWPFPTVATLGYPYLEVYPINAGNISYPQDFVSIKTNFKINTWDWYNLESIYNQASFYFPNNTNSLTTSVKQTGITTSRVTSSSVSSSSSTSSSTEVQPINSGIDKQTINGFICLIFFLIAM